MVFHKLLPISWDSHNTTAVPGGFTQDGPGQGKHLASGRCVQENAWLMSEVRGQKVRVGRETTETNNSDRRSNNPAVAPNVNLIK